PISSNPERTFGLTGLLLTANRARLQPDIIGVSMAVGSWDKEGIINIVDEQLSARRRKEQDIHGRKVTQHHAKTSD
ncbi:uncharacterized protein K441DRAFT_659154, partial [Cenococcum geophilum 1.58]|uniref:uncharacterized protein n=1 Tax=Cenococcum geophilum 1.58 TaxID=794803 RepID=UPI00358ECE9E